MTRSPGHIVRGLNLLIGLTLFFPPPILLASSPDQPLAARHTREQSLIAASSNTSMADTAIESPHSLSFGLPISPVKTFGRLEAAPLYLPVNVKGVTDSASRQWSGASPATAVTANSLSSEMTDGSSIVYACTRTQIGRTNDINAASPSWTPITPTGSTSLGTINDCVPDPWQPKDKMWVVGSTGIWKGENLSTTPAWTLVQSTYQITSTTDGHSQNGATPDRIIPSMSIPGTVFVLYSHSGIGTAKTWVGRSTDDGATWSWNKVANEGEQARDFGFAITQNVGSPDNVTVWASTNQNRLYKSTDGGKTFQRVTSLPSSGSFYPLHAIYSPLLGNDSSIVYVGGGSSSGTTSFISRTFDSGATWTTISPISGTIPRGPFRQYEIAGPALSSSHVYALVQRPQDVASENKKLYFSTDGGSTWSLRKDFASWTFEVLGVGVNSINEDRLYIIRDVNSTPNNLIFLSTDGGINWTDKSGNWNTAVGAWQPAVAVWDASYDVALLDDMARSCSLFCAGFIARNHKGGPIDTLSGNYTYQKSDESIPILGGSLALERSYSADARDLYTRTLGYGWTHNHEVRLVFPTDAGGVAGQVQLQVSGGSQLPFFDLGNGKFAPYPGVTAHMSQITATGGITTYVVTATNQTVYTFNTSGLVTQTVSPAGHVITYTYYPTGPLQSAQSHGRALNYAYDAQNRLVRVTDPINRATEFGYDANGDLTVVTDTRGLAWTYQYSGTTHLLTHVVDPDGRTVERTIFDGQGRAVEQYNGKNELVVQLEYGPGRTITVTDGLNHTSVDRYGRGTWLGGTDAAGQPLTRTYDLNFKPTRVADPNGNSTNLLWNTGGSNLERIVDAAGFTTTLSYDALNNLTRTVDARGFATTYGYSGTLLISQTDALANTWIYTYGLNNLLVAQQDPLGRVTRYEYNAFGQRTVVTDALGNATRYEYDGVGRLITTTDALGQLAVNAYDNADHLISVTENYTSTSSQQNYLEAFNRITRYGYDGFGRQVLVTDTLGRVTRSGYDAAGQLVSTTVNYSPTVGQNYLNQYNLVTQYGYDTVGNQTHVTDTLGFVTRTEYDSLNRPVTVTTNYKDGVFDPARPDEDLRRVTGYDPAGNAITQTDALGRVTRTWYDQLNRVISTTVNYSPTLPQNYQGEYNLVTQYAYDEVGNTILVTDTLGRVTRNFYDALGRVVSTTVNYSPTLGVNFQNQYNLTTRYEYDKVGNRVVVTDPLTGTTRYAYDALNRVLTTTDTLSGTSVTVYDAAGNRIKSIDALGHTTVYTYDAAYRLVASADAAGQITQYVYDALGNTRVVTDANGNPTLTAFDALNRVITTTNALSGTTVFGYDALSRQTVITDANGNAARTAYDGLGRPITTTDALGNQTVVGYDALGNRVKTIDGLGHTTVYTYDTLNRLVAQADPLGNTTRYAYDAVGNHTVMSDANSIVTQYAYDALNRLAVVSESVTTTVGLDPNAYNLVTRYGYDALGNRTVITNARGFTTTYTYDALYRMTAMRDPLGNTTRYAYDAVGKRTVMTDANAAVITYTYDLVNRLTRIGYPDSSVTYAYDKVGNRTVMTDSLGTTRYAYDALYRLTNVVDPYSQAITYTYDAVGNRTKLAYPDGKVVTYTFDAANRLTTVTDWSSQATTYAYDAAHRLITTTLPNTVRSVNAYDDANRLVRLSHIRFTCLLPLPPGCLLETDLVQTVLGQYEFGLDRVGNRTVVTETLASPDSAINDISTITYAYDPLYRLTDATYSGAYTYTFAYGYDAVGNRTAQTRTITSTLVTTYTYDAANRLATQNGQSSFAWDANGNLLQDGSTVYAYDFANRLISTTLSGVNTQFNYNGDGIRLRLIEAGALTTYTQDYVAPLPVVLQAMTGSASTQYVYSLGTRPLAEYEAAAWEYLLADPLDSVRQIANASGNVTLLKSYEPYGSVLNSQGTATSIFSYAGEQEDAYIKLVFLRARYYSPDSGTFLTKDAWTGDYARPQSLSGWNYVEGNPINFTDPSGLCREGDAECEDIATIIETSYKVTIDRGTDRCDIDPYILLHARGIAINWRAEELRTVERALYLTKAFLDQTRHPFIGAIGGRGYVIRRVQLVSEGPNNTATLLRGGRVWTEVPDNQFSGGQTQQPWQIANFVHESFHALDFLTEYVRYWTPYQTYVVPGPVSNDPAFSSDESLKRGTQNHSPRPYRPDCGPTNYACRNQFDNFADSAAVYALTWLTQNEDPTGLARQVLDAYGDVGAGGGLSRPVSQWDDNGLRKNFLDRYYGVIVR